MRDSLMLKIVALGGLVHTIYDFKNDGRRKLQVVVNEHLVATPAESVYSRVVFLRGLWMCIHWKCLAWSKDNKESVHTIKTSLQGVVKDEQLVILKGGGLLFVHWWKVHHILLQKLRSLLPW